MGFGKFLLGGICAVGAIVAAPVVLPAAAAVGAAVGGTAAAAGTAIAGTAAAAGTAIAGTAAAAGTAIAGTTVGGAAVAAGTAIAGTAAAAGTAITGAAATAGAAIAGTAAAAGTAIAESAVGTAAVGAMGAVGGAVGTAAGHVGLASVATVAGTEAGAAAVGAITTSTVVGAAGAASGVEKMKEASQTQEIAVAKYNEEKKKFDNAKTLTNSELENLGKLKTEIWKGFDRFLKALKKIGTPQELKELGLDKELHFDEKELKDIQTLSITANDFLKNGIASMAGSKLIGLAASAGISSLATASTGTAIAGLHGAAATNASLAALGGGSIASGGLGMAGGAVVSQGLTFAPALAITGIFLHSKGKKNLEIANETKEEADKLTIKIKEAILELDKLRNLSKKMSEELIRYRALYNQQVDWLEGFVEREPNPLKCLNKLPKEKREEEMEKFRNSPEWKRLMATGQLASILKDLTLTQLLTGTNENEEPKVESEKVNKKIEGHAAAWEKTIYSLS